MVNDSSPAAPSGQATPWCILRTAGRTTAKLVASLTEDGFEVWTPMETRSVRVPRANAKRRVRVPIMPTYVFVRADRLVDLLELSKAAPKQRIGRQAHARFRVVHGLTRIPLIADGQFAQLRELERRRSPPEKPGKPGPPMADLPIPLGSTVRMLGGSFGGLPGTVDRSDRETTLVCFARGFRVQIATSLLSIDEVCSASAAPDAA